MTMPSLEEEISQEYGSQVRVQEDPSLAATPDSPFGSPPASTGEAPPQGEAPPEQPGNATEPPPGTGTEAGTQDDDLGTEDLSDDDKKAVSKLDEDVEARIRAAAIEEFRKTEVPNIQRGFDRQIAALKDENTQLQRQQDELDKQIREERIKTLSPEEQEEMRKGWAHEDKAKELDKYADDLLAYDKALHIRELVVKYGEYGVTADDLDGMETPEEQDLFCRDKKIEFLESGPKNQPTNGAAPSNSAPATETPKRPAPAGASAPSDRGGGSVPPQAREPDKGRGTDAMANNISGGGWEPASFGRSR